MTAPAKLAALVSVATLASGPASAVTEMFGYQCCYFMASSSMLPTLERGEKFAVEKYAVGKLPVVGDLVVFRLPRDPSVVWVHRIVGVPGDQVQMINGVFHLNGAAVKMERLEDYVDTTGSSGAGSNGAKVKHWRETFPNGVTHEIIDLMDRGQLDNTSVYSVPAGNYFLLGDNRDNATDSRVGAHVGGVGFVPLENIVGKVIRPWKNSSPSGEVKLRQASGPVSSTPQAIKAS